MRTLNLTDFLWGTKVGSRKPPQPELTIIVRAAYVLSPDGPLRPPEGELPMAQGALSPDVLRDDDEEGTGAIVYSNDFADFKPRADVLLRGTCHAPRGRSVSECNVRFSVGRWSKTLRVLGARRWTRGPSGDEPSEPLGFTKLPLGYEHAFGGPGFAANPIGKGFGGEELPRIERPNDRLRSRSDVLPPAGFGPLNPAWEPRRSKVGKEYGLSYTKECAPFYAADFDHGHFNAAPADQQIEGYLRGDEEIGFGNLHPRAPSFSVKLPAIRVRAFVDDVRGRFREVPMRLDTLFADVDGERLYLTWRGVTAVAEDDLADVRGLLLTSEPLAGPARSEDEHRRELAAFLRDPAGLETAAPEHLRGAFQRLRANEPIGAPGRAGAPPNADPVSGLLWERLGALRPAEQEKLRAAIGRAIGAPLPEGTDLRAAMQQAVARLPKASPSASAAAPGAPPRVPGIAALRDVLGRAGTLPERAGAPLPGAEKLREALAAPEVQALVPSLGGEGPEPPIGPGADLSGRDLRGRDLRGADLSGANLSGALLTGASLRGAVLRGATLEGAVLFEADLSGADLSSANLTRAVLSSAKALDASFRGATLDAAQAVSAVLAGAVFDESNAASALFERADLSRARFRGARLIGCVFDGASAEDADFTGATLSKSRFLEVKAPALSAERAVIDGASFADAVLPKANLSAARGEAAIFLRTDLEGADLRWAVLPDAHFSEAHAARATFRAADLAGARFYRADVEEAFFTEARLFGADFRKAKLARARLVSAMAYDVKLAGADTRGMDVTSAFFGPAAEAE